MFVMTLKLATSEDVDAAMDALEEAGAEGDIEHPFDLSVEEVED